ASDIASVRRDLRIIAAELRRPPNDNASVADEVGRRCVGWAHFSRPRSISSRIASERDNFASAAHRSIDARSCSGNRTVSTGSRPVAGRPRPRLFFGVTNIDFLQIRYYIKDALKEGDLDRSVEGVSGMTSDNSASRSLIATRPRPLPATLEPEL